MSRVRIKVEYVDKNHQDQETHTIISTYRSEDEVIEEAIRATKRILKQIFLRNL